MGQLGANFSQDYWKNLQIASDDINYLTNILFENEEPLTIDGLTTHFFQHRIALLEKNSAIEQSARGEIYFPRDINQVGDRLQFGQFNWSTGTVKSVRDGNNPVIGDFKVIKVGFDDGTEKELVAGLTGHALNQVDYQASLKDQTDIESISGSFGNQIKAKLRHALDSQKDLVRIGYTWFPRSLLIDINKGQLNLVEAILDAQNGGPNSTSELITQLDIRSSENSKLLEFSMNYALQEDPRFDEVGTSGNFSWFLRRLEPAEVLEVPLYLRSETTLHLTEDLPGDTLRMIADLNDELTYDQDVSEELSRAKSAEIALIYPHWRAGSLPLTPVTSTVIPTALETERVMFSFKDDQSGETFQAWVDRPHYYITGLRDWYLSQNLIPGSIVELFSTDDPAIIRIRPQKKRTNKEWLKTLLIGADGGIVMALLRQQVFAGFDERMAIAIPDEQALDALWKDREHKKPSLKNDVVRMLSELAKLNQQRHVHFVDLYASINLMRRVSPQELIRTLQDNTAFVHVGDNYYNMAD
ncbi:MAG: hypothetical protein WBI14_04170 [Anaerolineaceae bacterium]